MIMTRTLRAEDILLMTKPDHPTGAGRVVMTDEEADVMVDFMSRFVGDMKAARRGGDPSLPNVVEAWPQHRRTVEGLLKRWPDVSTEGQAQREEVIELLREMAELLEAGIGQSSSVPLPNALPQQVFLEMRAMNQAIADGPSGRRWTEIEGEIAMRHVVPEQPHQTKFAPGSALLEWWGAPPRLEALRTELANAGLPAVLLASVAVGLALQHNQVQVSVDELGKYIGLDPRSRAERLELRQRVWRWLMLLDSLPVIGKRPGRYKDPRTKRELELTSVDAFIRIMGKRLPTQPTLDGSEAPIEVNFVAGPWINLYRRNRQVLSDFGDVLKIAAIPAGKPSGAWAQSIGLALNQRWRERAHDARIGRAGEENRITVQVGHFTREGLLDLFRAEPYFREVLRGSNQNRARVYWREAITLLKQQGVIGHYREIGALPDRRQGWQNAWLKQSLDIRPPADGTRAVVEIARKTRTARKTAKKAAVPS